MDKKMINQPYASFFEFVMGVIVEARKLFRYFLQPKYAEKFDWKTLKLEKGDFRKGITGFEGLITDVLYSCQWKKHKSYVQFVLEHKSYRENFKKQVLNYVMAIYDKQELDFKAAREAAKQAGKDTSKMRFKHTPVIIVIFYHGEEKWANYKFADQFDIPEGEEWLREFIPHVEVLFINMQNFTDDYIAQLAPGFLQPMLFLFKHKGDKKYLLQNTGKIFKFVGQLPFTKFVKEYIRRLFFFTIQTCGLENEEVKQIIQQLPIKKSKDMQTIEKEVLGGFDLAALKGQEKGDKKATKRTELKKSIETIVRLIKTLPDLANIDIVIISGTDLEFVAKVRAVFQTNEEKDIKKFVREVYQVVPDMTEKDYLEMEEQGVELWREFKGIEKK